MSNVARFTNINLTFYFILIFWGGQKTATRAPKAGADTGLSYKIFFLPLAKN